MTVEPDYGVSDKMNVVTTTVYDAGEEILDTARFSNSRKPIRLGSVHLAL